MRAPTGSVVGLCSASATMSAMGMAFLGYWGVHEPVPWRWADILVVCLAFFSFVALGSTIWLITTPVPEDGGERIVPARRAFAAGMLLMWLAIVIAVLP
jgi:fatty acid desaturase